MGLGGSPPFPEIPFSLFFLPFSVYSLRLDYANGLRQMATYRKVGKRWRVEIYRHGIRKSSNHYTKAEAVAWAGQQESEIAAGNRGDIPAGKTFGDLLERYQNTVSPTKRGNRWEQIRINKLLKETGSELARVRLTDLNASHIAAWRDARIKQVSAGSVRREWTLMSHACTVAVMEWRWLRINPMKEVKRPAPPAARDRRFTDNEIERLLFAFGYDYEAPPVTQTARVGAAMLWAIETGMRAGEIVGLMWPHVDRERRVATLLRANMSLKTAAAQRQVPLSTEAVRILDQLAPVTKDKAVFGLSSTQTLDAIFRKGKDRAVIADLHFHDTRHEAITRLAKKLDVLDLARMVGHRNLKELLIYYNPTASEIADRLR